MAFSQRQDKAIDEWLKKHDPECPVCKQKRFTSYNNFVISSTVDPSSSLRARVADILSILFECTSCGFQMFVEPRTAKVPIRYDTK
jgi:DNA-directed RNA polymerase subunit RPC12/RpoP